jgi:hypothetical protein
MNTVYVFIVLQTLACLAPVVVAIVILRKLKGEG